MPMPVPVRNASSPVGWIVAGLVAFFVLVPSCVAMVTALRARSARTRSIAPLPDPPPGPSTRVPPLEEDDDGVPSPHVPSARTSAPRRLTPSPRADAASPIPAPTPNPTPTQSSNRKPWENPPDLLSARATFLSALQIDDPVLVGKLRSFVIGTISPMTHECFHKFGFGFQKGQSLYSDVQLTIHADGHIDSFVELTVTGMHQVSCVEEKLTATRAPGVCGNTKPPSCTISVKLEGKYR
jgi:hypothetical protein